jgi:hypothetical protein
MLKLALINNIREAKNKTKENIKSEILKNFIKTLRIQIKITEIHDLIKYI